MIIINVSRRNLFLFFFLEYFATIFWAVSLFMKQKKIRKINSLYDGYLNDGDFPMDRCKQQSHEQTPKIAIILLFLVVVIVNLWFALRTTISSYSSY